MKYYETTCSEYIAQSKRFDMHPELEQLSDSMPGSLSELGNIIFYGPSGVGKYTQFLRFVEKYTLSNTNDRKLSNDKYKIKDRFNYTTETGEDDENPCIPCKQDAVSTFSSLSGLKTEKMTATTEKQKYEYHISDIHYEIDLALLGCESKKLWNECFFQIVDIVSAKKSKCGIILCKNFHSIHSELLDVFYSYMQHCRALSIHIVFAIMTEHVSFIPNRILQCCKLIRVKRPDAKLYHSAVNDCSFVQKNHKGFLKQINPGSRFSRNSTTYKIPHPPECILNLKETNTIINAATIPKDVFNIVCDNIIAKMVQHETIDIISLRDNLYDILLYGLDVTECLWYILHYFVENGILVDDGCREAVLAEIMTKINSFLKFYNNNYRPIYHLESIFIYLITKIYRYPSTPCENESAKSI